jgi:CheY-like chemotaxis protein
VRLPGVPAPRVARPVVPSPSVERVRRRILVIEDNGDARDMLRALLTLDGHEMHGAADGEAGIRMAATTSPDVALIDIGLPGLDGHEVARRIRAGPGGESILLIALTGYGRAEDRAQALDAGFDAHLIKPVVPERLAELLAGRRPAGPSHSRP